MPSRSSNQKELAGSFKPWLVTEAHWVVVNITRQSYYSGRYKHRNPTFLKTKVFRPVNGVLPSPTRPHPVLPYVQTGRCGPGEPEQHCRIDFLDGRSTLESILEECGTDFGRI